MLQCVSSTHTVTRVSFDSKMNYHRLPSHMSDTLQGEIIHLRVSFDSFFAPRVQQICDAVCCSVLQCVSQSVLHRGQGGEGLKLEAET